MTHQMRIKFVSCNGWEDWEPLKPLTGMELDDVYAIDFRVKPKYEPGWHWTVKDQYGQPVSVENRCVEWYSVEDIGKLDKVELERVKQPEPKED